MTDEQTVAPEDTGVSTLPSPPKGALETLLGLSGLGILVLVLCLVGYRVYGAQLTAGLDRACAEASFEAGQKLETGGNLAQAVLKYRQAMEGRFESDALRFMCGRAIGDLLFKQEKFEEAIEAYESLPPEAFDQSGAYTGYVTALWRAGQLERAGVLGETWLAKAQSEGEGEQEIWARNVLMHVAQSQGDSAAALSHGEAILEIVPGNDAAITVARILRGQGKTDAARACVETMLQHTESPSLRQAGRDLLDQLAREATQPGQS